MYLRNRSSRLPRALRGKLPAGSYYMGEDENFYYYMEQGATNQLGGMFDNIGNMFKRMVKFTPKSFTPKNIMKGFVNTTLTTATGGLYQVLPKNLKKAVYDVGKVAVPVIAGGVLAVTAGPAVMGILGPKLAAAGSLLGKGAMAGATVGGQVLGLLNKLPQNKQAEVSQRLSPEDIAYMEQYGQIPPHLKGYFDSMAQQTFNPPAPQVASPYTPFAPMGETPAPVEAGMLGGMDTNMLLLIGVPAAFFVLTQLTGKK